MSTSHARRPDPRPDPRPDDTPDLDPTPQARRTGGTVVPIRPLVEPQKVTRAKAKRTRKLKHLWRRKDKHGNEVGPYIIRKRINGQWINESTGFETIAEAERRRDERIKEVKELGVGWPNQKGTVSEWWAIYERDYLSQKKSPKTQHSHRMALDAFVAAYANRRLSSISVDECQAWLAGLATRGLEAGTRGLHRTNLKAFFGQAIKSNRLGVNPWKGTTPLKGEPRRTILDERDMATYLGALDPDDQRFALTVLETGLRHAEIDQLRPRDVRPDKIHVRAETAKYGRERFVPIQPETFATLEAQRQARGLTATATARLFDRVGYSRREVGLANRQRIRLKRFTAHLAKVGLDAITIHDLRRTYGTRCALAGVLPKMLMGLMGHKSLAVTMEHYIIVEAMQAADAVARVQFARPTPSIECVPKRDRKRGNR